MLWVANTLVYNADLSIKHHIQSMLTAETTIFVHLIPKFQSLKVADANILTVWKTINYSSVKASILVEAQDLQGVEYMKLLKAATTQWLSHGEACFWIICRFELSSDVKTIQSCMEQEIKSWILITC